MPEFYVNTETLSTESENLKTISDQVKRIASETLKILRKTKTSATSSIATLAKDTIVFASINLCAEEMKSLSKLLTDVVDLYNTSENNVISKNFNAAEVYMKGFSDDGFVDFSVFDTTDTYIDGRNDTVDAILFALTRPITDGIKSAINKVIGGDGINEEVRKETIIRMLSNSDSKTWDLSGLKDAIEFANNTAGAKVDMTDALLEVLGEEGLDKLVGGMEGKVLSNLSNLLTAGESGVEIVELCINDYANTISSLETMKAGLQAVGGDEKTIQYIDELIAEYNDKFATSVEKVTETALDIGVDKALSYATDAATGGLFSIVDTLHGGIWNAFDLPNKGESLAGVYFSSFYSDDLIAAYNHYAKKLQSGNYTQNDVDMCKSMFEMARNAKIDEYTNIKVNVGKEDKFSKRNNSWKICN